MRPGVHFIKPLDSMALMVGLLTPDSDEIPRWYKSYSVSIIITLGLSCAWSLYEKLHIISCGLSKPTVIMDLVLGVLLTLVNILSITKAVIQRKTMVKMLRYLNEVDSAVPYRCPIKKTRQKVFVVELLSILLAISGYTSYDVYVQLSLTGRIVLIPRLLMIINDYLIALTVLIFYTVMISLKDRFSNLNGNLFKIARRGNKMRDAKLQPQMLNISKTYHKLCCLIDLVNQHCGFQLLVIVTIIFVYVLQLVNMILNYHNEREIFMNAVPIVHLIKEYCVISVLYMVFGIMIASSCELVIKSATDTAQICHRLLLQYPLSDKYEDDPREQFVQEELMLLAHQVTHLKPKFTAADFFTVNYNMLYGMLGSIVSYIVIIIQL